MLRPNLLTDKKINLVSYIHPIARSDFSLADIYTILFFIFFSLLSRNFRIQYPQARIFDEVYFGNFSNFYINNEYFFDIHPPLAKMLFAAFAKLNHDPGRTNYAKAISEYPNTYYITLRQTAAFFSSFTGPLAYISMRIFGYSYMASFTAGFLITSDFMLIVEGHLILTDGILHGFVMIAVFFIALSHINCDSLLYLVLVGIGCGCCSSIKYTSLSIYVFACAHEAMIATGGDLLLLFKKNIKMTIPVYKNNKIVYHPVNFSKYGFTKILKGTPFARIFWRMIIICLIGFSITISLFYIHVIVLVYKGEGNQSQPPSFKDTIYQRRSKTTNLTNHVTKVSLTKRVFDLIIHMHKTNMAMTQKHGAQSNWYDWPFCRMKSIPYYTKDGMSLVLTPNPFVWFPAAIGAFISLLFALFNFIKRNSSLLQACIWPIGYFSSWLPFALIKRSIFVYHYLIPLMFGVLCFSTFTDIILQKHKTFRSCFFTLLNISCFICWIFFTPFLYSMVGYDWGIRMWYKDFF